MAVRGPDQRNFEFCRKYGLPIRVVVQPVDGETLDPEKMTAAFDEHERGKLVNSGPYTGLSVDDAILAISAHPQPKDFRQRKTTLPLKDSCLSPHPSRGPPVPLA